MNQRLKGLGLGSKRKSTANNTSLPRVATAPGPQLPGVLPGRPGPRSTSSSASSLNTIMNPHPGAGARPPSYSPGYPPGAMGNRTTSPPMPPGPGNPRTPPSQVIGGPPPINTTASGGYPPQHAQVPVGPPLQAGPGGPPQYVGGAYPNAPQGTLGAPVPYARNNAVEVEGAGRSKSQLIVGIDFVSTRSGTISRLYILNAIIGHNIFWSGVCIRIK
jgi:hypothetical protein